MQCVVHEVHDAIQELEVLTCAIEANKQHGVPYSRADKRRIVTRLLEVAGEMSALSLAELAGVTSRLCPR